MGGHIRGDIVHAIIASMPSSRFFSCFVIIGLGTSVGASASSVTEIDRPQVLDSATDAPYIDLCSDQFRR